MAKKSFVVWGLALCLLAVVAVSAQPKTGTDFYVGYRAAYAKATNMEALFPFISKEMRAKFDATPKDQRQMMFSMMKEIDGITDVKVVKETPKGDGAVLDVTGIGPDKKPVKGTVNLVKEAGAWKLQVENWEM